MTTSVLVQRLNFSYPGSDTVLQDFSLSLPGGSRCLLIGANGSGKSTFLQVLAGQYMVKKDEIRILDDSPFFDTKLLAEGRLSYLGSAWRRNIASAGDISAEAMIYGVADVDENRRSFLINLLEVDLRWRMHAVSEGQRRRVQICLGLLKPFKVLLLDEITVDIDVLGRLELLEFLKQESEQNGATIVYATHIFDGMEQWATHLAYIESGKLAKWGTREELLRLNEGTKLLHCVEAWLRESKTNKHSAESTAIKTTKMDMFPSKHMAFYR
eukprot:g6944.t1